jgi:hypothetical protein
MWLKFVGYPNLNRQHSEFSDLEWTAISTTTQQIPKSNTFYHSSTFFSIAAKNICTFYELAAFYPFAAQKQLFQAKCLKYCCSTHTKLSTLLTSETEPDRSQTSAFKPIHSHRNWPNEFISQDIQNPNMNNNVWTAFTPILIHFWLTLGNQSALPVFLDN